MEYDSYTHLIRLFCIVICNFGFRTITKQPTAAEAAPAQAVVRLIYEAHIKTTPFIPNTNRN